MSLSDVMLLSVVANVVTTATSTTAPSVYELKMLQLGLAATSETGSIVLLALLAVSGLASNTARHTTEFLYHDFETIS